MAVLTFNNSTDAAPQTLTVLDTVQEILDNFQNNPAATFLRFETETDIYQYVNKNQIQKISS